MSFPFLHNEFLSIFYYKVNTFFSPSIISLSSYFLFLLSHPIRSSFMPTYPAILCQCTLHTSLPPFSSLSHSLTHSSTSGISPFPLSPLFHQSLPTILRQYPSFPSLPPPLHSLHPFPRAWRPQILTQIRIKFQDKQQTAGLSFVLTWRQRTVRWRRGRERGGTRRRETWEGGKYGGRSG